MKNLASLKVLNTIYLMMVIDSGFNYFLGHPLDTKLSVYLPFRT